MYLPHQLSKRYTNDNRTALEAQRVAHEILQAPIVFQVSRLMIKFGILQILSDSRDRLTESFLRLQLSSGTLICSKKRENRQIGFICVPYVTDNTA